MTRTERKALAAKQRREWGAKWLAIAREHVRGGTLRTAMTLVLLDANKMATKSPNLRSEIQRALDEFAVAMQHSIDAVKVNS